MHLLCAMPDSDEQYVLTKSVLEHDAQLANRKNLRGETALHLCCIKSTNGTLLQLLLDKGASTSATANTGLTAIEIADGASKDEFVNILLGHRGSTPLVHPLEE